MGDGTVAGSRSQISVRECLLAGVATLTVPVVLAFGIYWWAPWGCDASAWLCLFPLALLGIAPLAALCLPVLALVDRRDLRPRPGGWLAVPLATGTVAQLCVSGYGLWQYSAYLRHTAVVDVLFLPQGFAAGVIAGGVFRAALWLAVRGRDRVKRGT